MNEEKMKKTSEDNKELSNKKNLMSELYDRKKSLLDLREIKKILLENFASTNIAGEEDNISELNISIEGLFKSIEEQIKILKHCIMILIDNNTKLKEDIATETELYWTFTDEEKKDKDYTAKIYTIINGEKDLLDYLEKYTNKEQSSDEGNENIK